MIGAIIGDIVGSPYEFFNVYKRNKVKAFEKTIHGKCQITDDSVMTLAVGRALVENINVSDEILETKVAENLQKYYFKYPLIRSELLSITAYGGGFSRWAEEDISKCRTAQSNGAAMRIAAAGWLYNDLEKSLKIAELTVRRTHNSKEAIASAQAIVQAVFLSRHNKSKSEIRASITERFGYEFPVGHLIKDEVVKIRNESKRHRREALKKANWNSFIDCDAEKSARNAIYAFLISKNFKDCINTAISFGGDSDTLACMAGAIAEAYYGIPDDWKEKAMNIIRQQLKVDDVLFVYEFHQRYCSNIKQECNGKYKIMKIKDTSKILY